MHNSVIWMSRQTKVLLSKLAMETGSIGVERKKETIKKIH